MSTADPRSNFLFGLALALASVGCDGGGEAEPDGGALDSAIAADASLDGGPVIRIDAGGTDAGPAPSAMGCLTDSSPARYYVATTGSDDGPGSAAAPFATIQHAADVAGPGDRVRVTAGTYYERVVIPSSGLEGAPIVFEGECGRGGEWLTTVSGGDPRPLTWTPSDVGPGVWETRDIGYAPMFLTLGEDGMLFRLNSVYMEGEPSRGFGHLRTPADAMFTGRYADITVNYWDDVEALFGSLGGVTYVRFRDGDDPNPMNLVPSPDGILFDLLDRSYVVVRNFRTLNATKHVRLGHETCHHNVVEHNHMVNGADIVSVRQGCSSNRIHHNVMHLSLLGDYQMGAWNTRTDGDGDYRYGVREHFYWRFKAEVGADGEGGGGESFWPTGVEFVGVGSDNEFSSNHVYNLAAAVFLIDSLPSGSVSGNTIHHTSGSAIYMTGGEDTEIFDNLLYDVHQPIRIWKLEDFYRFRGLYIYRNRIWNPDELEPLFYISWADSVGPDIEPAPDEFAEVYIYQNTVVGGDRAVAFNGHAAVNYGARRTLIVNNLIQSTRAVAGSVELLSDAAMVGGFDHNWIGTNWGWRGRPAWAGDGNIEETEVIWPYADRPADFALPSDSSAREGGIDLSRPFTVNGAEYPALPGMSSGYFAGPTPDIGAVQYRASAP